MNEKQIATNYLVNLYNDVLSVNNFYAGYVDFRVKVIARAGGNEQFVDSLNEEEAINFSNLMTNIRIISSRLYIQVMALANNNLLSSVRKDVIVNFNKIVKMEPKIKLEELEEYTVALNEIINSDLIKNVLTSAEDMFMNTYGQKP